MNQMTLSKVVVKNILDASIQQEMDSDQLTQLGIEYNQLTINPDDRIGIDKYLQIEKKIGELAGKDDFFLYVGSILDPMPPSVKYIVINSSDNKERINYVLRYLRLICETYRMILIEKVDCAEIHFQVYPLHFQTISTVQMVMSNIFCGLKSICKDDISFMRVNFQHTNAGFENLYQNFFKIPVWFNQEENSIIFRKDVLSQINAGHPYLKDILIQHAEQLLKDLDISKEFCGAVRKIISENLHTGDVNINSLERAIHMSRQTIYRKLKREGNSFSNLLNDVRKEQAIEFLKTNKSIEEIAFLLGYSETSSFNHAFKQWFGKSMIQHKKSNQI
jgi:AraC-like DNA-binding protein